MVCARRYFAEGSGAQGARGGPHLSQERRQGAGEHGSHHPAQPALYRLVRMERQAHQGKHEALVPVELWERVQGVLDGRFASKAKRGKHDFAFSGLIACHACGCAVVGEIKKQRYVYYHCTGYADKCQGNPASCRRKYVREEALEAQFTELLGRLRFDDEVLEWVRDALHASHADERREHEEAIKRHQAEYKRLQDRIQRHVCRQARRAGGHSLL